QSAFDAHAAQCAACAEELRDTRQAEQRMTALFAGAMPVAGMEDRVIRRLRLSAGQRHWLPTIRLNPALSKATAGVAAAIVLAGMGYAVTQVIDNEQPMR